MNEQSIRETVITPNYLIHPEGSVLIEMGQTKVICNATIDEKVPPFLRGQDKGWVTAEYSMLPRATEQRNVREASRGKLSGRTMEIQRLIGRSLRSVVDLEALGERTIWLDCDVIQADGGTRTASITGAFVALVIACNRLMEEEAIERFPITDYLAAISVGVDDQDLAILDLNYEQDVSAKVDMNIVMTGKGEFVEIQGTGEETTFSYSQLEEMLRLAKSGITELIDIQKTAIAEVSPQILNMIK